MIRWSAVKATADWVYWAVVSILTAAAIAGFCLFALTQWFAPFGSDLHAPAWIVAGNHALHHFFPNLVFVGVEYVVGVNLRPGHESVAFAAGLTSHLLYTVAMVTWFFCSRRAPLLLRALVLTGLLVLGTTPLLLEPALFIVRPFVAPLFV